MNRNKKNGIIAFVIIIAVALFFAVVDLLDIFHFRIEKDSLDETSGNVIVKGKRTFNFGKRNKSGSVALLYIDGEIQKAGQTYNQSWLIKTIKTLKDDKDNRAIALHINSPGGTVYEADEVYLALEDYKTTGKVIYVYEANLSTSGAYYISCAGNKIYANRNTLTGSIGVISAESFDLTELLGKIGISSETIHSGKNKNMFNFNEKVTDEQRLIMQGICDECYEQFLGIVSLSRGIDAEKMREIADGRLYTAKEALALGLIDSVDNYENMIYNMEKECFNGNELERETYRYEKEFSLREALFSRVLGGNFLSMLEKVSMATSGNAPRILYR